VSGNKPNERKRSETASILVIIEKGENSYGTYAPDVPGCVAVGEMREEVEQLMKEALRTSSDDAGRTSTSP
jgi:predicted RNase H-like HicB family nuclease